MTKEMDNLNIELVHVDVEPFHGVHKNDLVCWPGRSKNCGRPREWAVFHDENEAKASFDYLTSIYIGTCSEHLPLALHYHPTALNYIRPYPGHIPTTQKDV